MQTYHFTLIVEGPDMQDEVVIDALFDNGCDDGTVGRSDDVQFIVFDREAASLVEAVRSAINDIERTPGLKVIQIAGTDLTSSCGLADHIEAEHSEIHRLIASTNATSGEKTTGASVEH